MELIYIAINLSKDKKVKMDAKTRRKWQKIQRKIKRIKRGKRVRS